MLIAPSTLSLIFAVGGAALMIRHRPKSTPSFGYVLMGLAVILNCIGALR